MRSNNKSKRKSLFGKSMEMAASVIKLSSFSIANMSPGTARSPPAAKNFLSTTSSVTITKEPQLHQIPQSRRSQVVKRGSKPFSYLVEPEEGSQSSLVIHEEDSVDCKAWDYIRKVHEQNQNDSNETLMLSSYALPPPTSAMK